MNLTITWQLILYPISWMNSSLFLYLFFCLIFMRFKIDLVNGLCALYFLSASVFALLQVGRVLTFLEISFTHHSDPTLLLSMRKRFVNNVVNIFQQHFLFQIRVVGDIFISGDYFEEDVPDIKHYLNKTCKK